MKKTILLIFSLLLGFTAVMAQELNVKVSVSGTQIGSADQTIFETLQESLNQLVNNRKWTNLRFKENELIQGSMLLTLKEFNPDDNTYKGEIQLTSTRPVYNSSYTTPIFNFRDTNLEFTYTKGQNLDFSENNISDNLTATVAFYVYILLGLDFDSFSLNGGKSFFEKAMLIANGAQSLSGSGWAVFGNDRNRYALALSFTEESSSTFHDFWYNYHRKGLDEMANNPQRGRLGIIEVVPNLEKLREARPSSVLFSVFGDTKLNELISIYTQANTEEKEDAYKILTNIYPTRKSFLGKIKQQ